MIAGMTQIFEFDSLTDTPTARWVDLVKRWEDTGDHFRMFSQPNDHSASGAEFAIDPGEERWLQYDVWFAPDFDFGSDDRAHHVTGKMPGLGSRGVFSRMNGNHTGGTHSNGGFSGRIVWRGWNSQGDGNSPADGIALSLYAYHDDGYTRPQGQRYGRDYYFRKAGAEVNPAMYNYSGGTGPGSIGDADVWLLPVGEWITVTVGYSVALGGQGFEAWTSTESDPTPVRRLRLDQSGDFRWLPPSARREVDTFLFQSYWGGGGSEYHPTTMTELRYRRLTVHDSNPLEQAEPVVEEPYIPQHTDRPSLDDLLQSTPHTLDMAGVSTIAHERQPAIGGVAFSASGYRTGSWGKMGRNLPTGLAGVEIRGAAFATRDRPSQLGGPITIEQLEYWHHFATSNRWAEIRPGEITISGGGYYGDPENPTANPWAGGSAPAVFPPNGPIPWRMSRVMAHVWAEERLPVPDDVDAELLIVKASIDQGTAATAHEILAAFGTDYWPNGHNPGQPVPGPGIGRMRLLTSDGTWFVFLVTPADVPSDADSLLEWITDTAPLPAGFWAQTESNDDMPVTTTVPVVDTVWQAFGLATTSEFEAYTDKLVEYGFDGFVSFLLHHDPVTHLGVCRATGEQIGDVVNGEIRLRPSYVSHVRQLLDIADGKGLNAYVGAAWQNTYLPGGGTGNPAARGTLTVSNAAAYARHLDEQFESHPALAQWVFGGDAGFNNTVANIEPWRIMATELDSRSSETPIAYHTPTDNRQGGTFDHLKYVGERWLTHLAVETGHQQEAPATGIEIARAIDAYGPGVVVGNGEPRYHRINYDWVNAKYRDPQSAEMVADAIASRDAGAGFYWYGDGQRWHWATQGQQAAAGPDYAPEQIALTFGSAEREVLRVFSTPANSGGTMQVEVMARGTTGSEEIALIVDGVDIGPHKVLTVENQLCTWTNVARSGAIQVAFVNDGLDANGKDRNAIIERVTIVDGDTAVSIPSTHPDVLSTGTWQQGVGCEPMFNRDRSNDFTDWGWLHCGGELDFTQPLTEGLAAVDPVDPDPDPDPDPVDPDPLTIPEQIAALLQPLTWRERANNICAALGLITD